MGFYHKLKWTTGIVMILYLYWYLLLTQMWFMLRVCGNNPVRQWFSCLCLQKPPVKTQRWAELRGPGSSAALAGLLQFVTGRPPILPLHWDTSWLLLHLGSCHHWGSWLCEDAAHGEEGEGGSCQVAPASPAHLDVKSVVSVCLSLTPHRFGCRRDV